MPFQSGPPGPGLRDLTIKLVVALAAAGIVAFLYRLYQVRTMVRRTLKQPGVVRVIMLLNLPETPLHYLAVMAQSPVGGVTVMSKRLELDTTTNHQHLVRSSAFIPVWAPSSYRQGGHQEKDAPRCTRADNASVVGSRVSRGHESGLCVYGCLAY